MALIKLNHFSEALGMCREVNVIIPQKSTVGQIGVENKALTDKYKCLYLLHGLSDDHTIWLRMTSIERYAADYGIAVVMPCADKSFYCDMKYGGKYYTYIAKELPKLMCEFFNISARREDNYIAGLSMGGYGAIKIGLKENDRFCKAAGLSSVADVKERSKIKTDGTRNFKEHFINIFGEDVIIPDDEDLFLLSQNKNNLTPKPDLYMGVGKDDFMYEDNVKLKEHIEKLDYNYTYNESEGAHNWEFWDREIVNVLKWMFD